MSVITLLTDFGTDDEYAGVMKGAILSVNPKAFPVDITHQIDPQDLIQAAYTINAFYRFFPPNTVHVTVVDPGVGTRRGIVALKTEKFCFLAPDNGVLTLLLEESRAEEAVWVQNSDYFLNNISRTFHGRDIFAPVAGYLSKGLALNRLGPKAEISQLKRLDLPGIEILENKSIEGRIISVDRFGNLVTNIGAETIDSLCAGNPEIIPAVEIGGIVVEGISDSYSDVPTRKPLMIIGSRNLLEISVKQGEAGRLSGKKKGDKIRIILKNQGN